MTLPRRIPTIAALIALAGPPAIAADMRMPPRSGPLPLAYNWTGFYLGGHLGSAWSNGEWTTPGAAGADASINSAVGFIGGGQAGWNYQFASRWVIGIEGDFTGSTMNRSVGGCFADATQTCTMKNQWTALVTGRLGYAFDASLFYVKGGAAWGHFNYENPDPVSSGQTFSANQTRRGWTIGGGWEYAFTPNWSAKIEYNFLDFGDESVTLVGPSASFTENIKNDIHQVKLGVNYRFPVAF